MADDLLPCKPDNARRRVNDAEVVTLCVAQSIMGCPEDPRFLARARKELRHLFPESPQAARPLEAPPPTRGDDRAPGSRSSPPNAPAPTTTSSSSTRPRSNAGARSRPRGARRSRRGARAATAQAIPATSGGCACMASSEPTGRREPGRWRPRTSASGRWPRRCSLDPFGRRGGHRRQGLRRSRLRGRGQRPRRHAVSPRPQGRARARPPPRPRSASGSSRSFAPARTSSSSSATERERSPDSGPESSRGCWRSAQSERGRNRLARAIFADGPGWIRTTDRRIMSPLL